MPDGDTIEALLSLSTISQPAIIIASNMACSSEFRRVNGIAQPIGESYNEALVVTQVVPHVVEDGVRKLVPERIVYLFLRKRVAVIVELGNLDAVLVEVRAPHGGGVLYGVRSGDDIRLSANRYLFWYLHCFSLVLC
jgi:hypothetical protein